MAAIVMVSGGCKRSGPAESAAATPPDPDELDHARQVAPKRTAPAKSAPAKSAPAKTAQKPAPATPGEDMSDPSPSPTVSRHAPAKAAHGNRLGNETSPYLLQHAHNPVNWYAWGPDAFEAARKQDKPIFLSIGYSTCYWCHVMERESFENEAIAAIMNEHFICIKVDREERPDVDDIYMAATQALNQGRGGWPMSVFLEPNLLKPFFAGTYFPPEDRQGQIGFPSLLTQLAEAWSAQREMVEQRANEVANFVAQQLSRAVLPQPLGAEQVDQAIGQLMSSYDRADGGFGPGRNKFPMPANLDLLIGAAWKQSGPRQAVINTLDRMATGGMYDQIGG
ncbi:MAG: thioredoxin domain-containing protein, partial [Planctomycetota bacterium]